MRSATRQIVEGLAAAELFVVALIAPALLFPSPRRLLIALLIPPVWLAHRRVSGRLLPSTPLNTSLGALLIMVFVSLFATFDLTYSLGKVSGVVLGVVLFWALTRWTTSHARLEVLMLLYVAAGAALAFVGLLGTNWIAKFPLLNAVVSVLPKSIRGVPGAEEGFHPNPVAGCLVLFVPLQVALIARGYELPGPLAVNRRKLSLLVQSALLLLTAGTLLLTQSRGAWTGLLAALIAFLSWYDARTRRVAVAFTGALLLAVLLLGPQRMANLAISSSGPGMAGNVSSRMDLWSSAIRAIEDFPITGMGMNAFRKVMPTLYPPALVAPDYDVAHAHNHLLQAALDLGIAGLVAYLSIWIVVAALLAETYRRAQHRLHRAVAGSLGAGLIAHFVFSLTDAIPLGAKVGVLFWLALALAVAVHQVGQDRSRALADT